MNIRRDEPFLDTGRSFKEKEKLYCSSWDVALDWLRDSDFWLNVLWRVLGAELLQHIRISNGGRTISGF